jgi:hypothetical protein
MFMHASYMFMYISYMFMLTRRNNPDYYQNIAQSAYDVIKMAISFICFFASLNEGI